MLRPSLRKQAEHLVLHPMFSNWENVDKALSQTSDPKELANLLRVSVWEAEVFLARRQNPSG